MYTASSLFAIFSRSKSPGCLYTASRKLFCKQARERMSQGANSRQCSDHQPSHNWRMSILQTSLRCPPPSSTSTHSHFTSGFGQILRSCSDLAKQRNPNHGEQPCHPQDARSAYFPNESKCKLENPRSQWMVTVEGQGEQEAGGREAWATGSVVSPGEPGAAGCGGRAGGGGGSQAAHFWNSLPGRARRKLDCAPLPGAQGRRRAPPWWSKREGGQCQGRSSAVTHHRHLTLPPVVTATDAPPPAHFPPRLARHPLPIGDRLATARHWPTRRGVSSSDGPRPAPGWSLGRSSSFIGPHPAISPRAGSAPRLANRCCGRNLG